MTQVEEIAALSERERSTVEIPIIGMTCASCVRRVEKALLEVSGVESATANLATERAKIGDDPTGGPGTAGRHIRSTPSSSRWEKIWTARSVLGPLNMEAPTTPELSPKTIEYNRPRTCRGPSGRRDGANRFRLTREASPSPISPHTGSRCPRRHSLRRRKRFPTVTAKPGMRRRPSTATRTTGYGSFGHGIRATTPRESVPQSVGAVRARRPRHKSAVGVEGRVGAQGDVGDTPGGDDKRQETGSRSSPPSEEVARA